MSFLSDFCGGQIDHIKNLPPDDQRFIDGKLLGDVFTAFVDSLRNTQLIACKPINELMALLWQLVGNHICPCSIMPGIPCLSFWCEIRDNKWFSTIICPQNWLAKIRDDLQMQLGAMVSNASRARDYWNRIIPGYNCTKEEADARAMSYESEFLKYISERDKDFIPNKYQINVMEKFPKGLATRPDLRYQSRPFPTSRPEILLAGPPYPVDIDNLNA